MVGPAGFTGLVASVLIGQVLRRDTAILVRRCLVVSRRHFLSSTYTV